MSQQYPYPLVKDCRVCTTCNNLVTTDTACPLCSAATILHPDAESTETTSFCIDCGREFPTEDLRVITWHQDPHSQDDDDDIRTHCLSTVCLPCLAKRVP